MSNADLMQSLCVARYKNLGALPGMVKKIPAVLHHIWLTDPSDPRPIDSKNLEKLQESIQILNSDLYNNWQVKVWSNVPLSQVEGAEIASIFDLKLTDSAEASIEYIIKNHYWGMGSDFLRYLIIQNEGGFYADLGFDLHRAPGQDLYRYDFFANQWAGLLNANNFFAAKPHHPILDNICSIVTQNLEELRNDNPALSGQSLKDMTTALTAEPFNSGYYEYLEQNNFKANTTDVIIPHSRFHNNKNFIFDCVDPNLPVCNSWDEMEFNDMCVSDDLFIGQDALAGETWY